MSAANLAARVLTWATDPQGPPPEGRPSGIETLVEPDEESSKALARLVSCTAAQLCLSPGAVTHLTHAAVITAAVVGLRRFGPIPAILLESLDGRPPGPADHLAFHAVVRPALPYLDKPLATELYYRSPLTALLVRPLRGQESAARAMARQLAALPGGERALRKQFGCPADKAPVRNWRAALMERWRLAGGELAELALSIYEYAMVYHAEALMRQIDAAHAALFHAYAANDDQLAGALATARWWKALQGFTRTRPEELRRRRYLHYNYRRGIRLYRDAARIPGVKL
ncbi:MAG: hypothetical protein QNK37_33915 [Acidobacteriota bacterium]|nr:hypothetical protein [Acidobacteriota bacterium]